MSQQQIGLNPDLQKLRNEGYDVEVRAGHLLVKDVPYVTADRKIKRGVLVSRLEMSGDVTNRPTDHVAMWAGEHPCHSDGSEIAKFKNSSARQELGGGIVVEHTFSAKAEYRDYHHKMTTYIHRSDHRRSPEDRSPGDRPDLPCVRGQ